MYKKSRQVISHKTAKLLMSSRTFVLFSLHNIRQVFPYVSSLCKTSKNFQWVVVITNMLCQVIVLCSFSKSWNMSEALEK